ncbi:MAG: CotH kinase family protein, partial [Bacteroidota bacterium]
VSGLDVDVQSYRPMAAYLNGAYWGLLNLRERTNEHYLAMRHGVDPDAIDLFQILWGHETPEVIQGDLQPFLDLLTFVEARDPLTEADLAVVAEAVDLGSYIDYHAAQLYFNNRDWPGNNVKVWRPGTPGARWRWALFDTDTGFGYFGPEDAEMNTLAFATDPNGQTQTNLPRSTLLLRRLLSAETFRDRFASRFADLLNGPFRPDSVVATVNRLAGVIAPEFPRHRARWPPSAPDWEDQIETLRDFGRRRPASVREHLRDGLGLGAPMPLTIRTRGAGYVRLGTLGAVNGDWTGTYFSGLRVEVEAIPAVGMRFVCWSDGSTSRLRRVDPGAVSELEARFEAAAPGGASVVVNEIQYNPPDDADSEDWVELLNTGEATVDLSGWVLSDEDDDDQAELPAGTSLAPGGYLVLCRDPDAFAQIHPSAAPCLGGWDFGLSGGGDQVRLFDASGALRDSVAYDDEAPWPTAPDGDGATLELFSSDLDNADASSWRASSVRGGTPGAFNSVAVDAEPVPAPNRLSLATPFPNPFRTPTSIQFVLPSRGGVDLRLFDALGREVARLAEGDRAEGPHAVSLDVPGLAPGVYLVRLRTEAGTLARRVTKVE